MPTDDRHWRELRDDCLEELIKQKQVERLKPLSPNQSLFLDCLEKKVITVGLGPAGVGKSWLSCGKAAQFLNEGRCDRIILTRPLVTCGKDKVGFLPGELDQKTAPFARPMLDAFADFFNPFDLSKLLREKKIEMVPLEYMQGLSLKNAFIICDEAQNADYAQLLLLLTRIDKKGKGTKVVLIGAPNQSQLTGPEENPFKKCVRSILGHPDISLIRFGYEDVVRSPLIQWIEERMTGGFSQWEFSQVGESWYSERCPTCQKTVWYNNGDEDDFTVPDIEYVRCWYCGGFLQLPEYEGEGARMVEIDEAWVAEGYPQKS